MAALPQAIQSAKELYDLRSRYKDASVLITAIYSESMVIAASLSQVQNLLEHAALQNKPQLLETFDRALTGCRVVYGCLEEEVRELAAKAETDDLKFKDRAKFLWKEDTFKELLTQIRGQQSALSLLIQGLQMESIADIRKLVEDNSVTLDQVVKRSRTLRQSHPRVKVPDSLFKDQIQVENATDADSVMKSAAEFTFDDEVINSKAYRRAMAHYMHSAGKEPLVSEAVVAEDASTEFEPASQIHGGEEEADVSKEDSPQESLTSKSEQAEAPDEVALEGEVEDTHQDLFDTLERDILAFMPSTTSISTPSAPSSEVFETDQIAIIPRQVTGPLTPAPLRSFSDGKEVLSAEVAPPLPPRRPSGPQLRSEPVISVKPKASSSFSDDSMYTSDALSILSKVSTASSYTTYDTSSSAPELVRTQPTRKPLPLAHQASYNSLASVQTASSHHGSSVAIAPFESAEMHHIWVSLLDAERKYIDRMMKLRRMFYDNIVRHWPLLGKHLEAILIGEQLAKLNTQYLLHAMEKQITQDGMTTCDSSIFESWTKNTHRLVGEFCQRLPHAVSSIRTTQAMDPKFAPFVNTLGLSIAYFGMTWEDYMRLPSVQLQTYVDSLQSLLNVADGLHKPGVSQEAARLRRALNAVIWLRTKTAAQLEEAQGREDVKNLEKRIIMDFGMLSQLQLPDPARRVLYQGGMAVKWKSQGPWTPIQVILLNNYLLWGKTRSTKKIKGDTLVVTDDVRSS